MIINPTLDAENIFTEYPLLAEIAALFPDKEIVWHKYFRYLALCYEQDSPMMKRYPDITIRKRFAAAEVEYTGDHYPEIAIEFIKRVIRSRQLRELHANEFLLEEYFEMLTTPISKDLDDDKKLKAVTVKNTMREQLPGITEACERLYEKLYGGDKELEEHVMANMSPETMAKMMR